MPSKNSLHRKNRERLASVILALGWFYAGCLDAAIINFSNQEFALTSLWRSRSAIEIFHQLIRGMKKSQGGKKKGRTERFSPAGV